MYKHGKVNMSRFLNVLLHEHLDETPTISQYIFFCSKKNPSCIYRISPKYYPKLHHRLNTGKICCLKNIYV